jgi:eukaryotic-like serine/threonine-protein kinase
MAIARLGAKEIFLQAVEIASPTDRAAYLDQACRADSDQRRRVEALLIAHERPESLLDQAAINAQPPDATIDHASAERPGTVVAGRYKLLEQIGEGGMGTVWIAEQTQPVRRKVALKLVKLGMDSRQVLSRFEAERQALALMDHPNIAKVFDGGLTEQGRPFFVMEYVKGIPLTAYCDSARLTVQERLKLFGQVCQAVQHAHQKGIIHRDLKPSNILVCLYDGQPVPKVIDFGLAKAIHQPLTEHTLHTAHGLMVGTPLYMSPEQAEFNNLDVDTRTDIYSLGVILYELLTGATPLEKQQFKNAAFAEILRLIKEEEPLKPSLKLSTSASLPSVAAQRSLEPAQLSRTVRGDLDWIVMKALEKDRSRRYETANGLARDIDRYLSDEPVEACPPSTGYRLRKYAHKHQRLLATAVAFALLLVMGVVVSTWQAVRARHAEVQAKQSAAKAQEEEQKARAAAAAEATQRQRAEENERQAKASEEEAKAVLTFFDEKVLAAGGPERRAEGGLGKDLTIRRAIDAASMEIATTFQDRPLVEASIRNVLGRTYFNLGEYSLATQQLERALALRQAKLDPDHPDRLMSMFNLGEVYLNTKRREQARPLAEETLKRRRATLGREHIETLRSLWLVAKLSEPNEGLPLFEESYQLRRATLGPKHPDTLRAMSALARQYRAVGKAELGLPLSEEAVHLMQATVGQNDSQTQMAMSDLSQAYREAGKLDQALPLAEDAFRLSRATHGEEHLYTSVMMQRLVEVYEAVQQYAKAIQLGKELLVLRRSKLPADDPSIATSLATLGLCLLHTEQPAEAEPLLRECLAIRQKKEPDSWQTFQTQSLLGGSLLDQQKFTEAQPLLLAGYEGMKQREAKIPESSRNACLTEALQRLVDLYTAWGKTDESETWRKMLSDRKTPQSPTADSTEKP